MKEVIQLEERDQIKEIVLNLGADVCGIANIKSFDTAPKGFQPAEIFADCKSVVVFGLALPKGLTKVDSKLIYAHYNSFICSQADSIALNAAKQLEKSFCEYAVPLPSDGPYDYWDSEKMEGRGLISMKHAAVATGLGTLGKSTLLLNSKYGNLLTLGAVLTDLDLPSDPPAENICIQGCSLCLRNCPVQALDGESAIQSKCRINTYGTNARGFSTVNCNKCRTICPMRFGKPTSQNSIN